MIVFDLQAVQSVAHGERGIARYTAEVAAALARRGDDIVDVFAYNDRLPHVERLDSLDLGGRLRSFSSLRGRHADLVHVNSPFEMLQPDVFTVPVLADRLVATCYDLIPLRFSRVYLTDPRLRALYLARMSLLLAADEIVTDSESAASDVANMLGYDPGRMTSLGAGVDERFVPPTTSLEERMGHLRAAVPDLLPGYVLIPSGMDWRKNTDGAIAAYSRLDPAVQRRHQLVVACRVSEHEMRRIDDMIEVLGTVGDVLFTDFVSDDDLVRLYQTAELVCFPSFYEGFGLPVLEARRCGARVICSNAASLPEVLADPIAHFNPHDPDDIAESLRRALVDPVHAARLDRVADSGFTWDLAAERLVEVYERVRTRARRVPNIGGAPPRARIAVATLLPPTFGGVADHSAHLLTEMAKIADVTAFVTDDAAEVAGDDVWEFPVEAVRTLPSRVAMGDFDHVVYCMGNNEMHAPFVPMLGLTPGHLLLHDVRLSGCADAATRAFGFRRDDDDAGDYDADGADRGLGMKSIIRLGASVMVHSTHARDLVADETSLAAVDVGPHPYPSDVTIARTPSASNPLVVSAGIAHTSKGSDTFATAMAELVTSRTEVAAALVGAGGNRWVPLASDRDRFAPVPGDVVATGDASAEHFDTWLAAASVAVQLRRTTNGESSGVVAQLLARGVPTIVSDLGAMRELPDDVVVKVDPDIDADGLCAVVTALLDDVERRRELHRRALDHVRENTYAHEAARIVEALGAFERAGAGPSG